MKIATQLTVLALGLGLALFAACNEPTTTEQTAATGQGSGPDADIAKAAELYKVLHDRRLDDAQMQERAGALLEANGWTEESYQALLFEITADPATRERYLRAIE